MCAYTCVKHADSFIRFLSSIKRWIALNVQRKKLSEFPYIVKFTICNLTERALEFLTFSCILYFAADINVIRKKFKRSNIDNVDHLYQWHYTSQEISAKLTHIHYRAIIFTTHAYYASKLHFSTRKLFPAKKSGFGFRPGECDSLVHASFELHENRVGFLRTDTRESFAALDRSTLQIQGEIIAPRPRIAGTWAIKSMRGEERERKRVREKTGMR